MSNRGELFDGRWTIDAAASTVWDDETKTHVPDEVGLEIITIKTVDDVQDYEVLYGDSPTVRMGYASKFDDPEWVPYLVRGIEGVADEDTGQAIEDFKRRIKADRGHRERSFEIGKVYSWVRTIFVDDRTQYRVHAVADSRLAQAMMLRRLAEDGQSYVATVLDVDGIVHRVRRFVRLDEQDH